LQSTVYVKLHELENNANVQGNGSIVSDCSAASTDCTGIDYRAVEYFDKAGPDFSGYTHPACTTTVAPSTLNNITGTGVVCVNSGTYTGDVSIPANVELVAVNAPDGNAGGSSMITGKVTLNEGSTLKGFVISGTQLTTNGYTDGGAVTVSGNSATVDSNIITQITGDGLGTASGIFIVRDSSTTLTNTNITNNQILGLRNTGKGLDGIVIQGNVDRVSITNNEIGDLVSVNTTSSWDYALGIEDTSWSGGYSPKNLVIENNTLNNIHSVKELGRGFSVDMSNSNVYADASKVTLKYNNFLLIPNVLTNKDQSTDTNTNTLVAKDNYFDKLTYNVNGVAKGEIGPIDAGWMTKTSFSIAPHGVDKFATLASFPKMLYPDTYTVNTTVTA